MKNLYLFILLFFVAVACAPQKYGRYFNQRPYQTQSESRIKTDTTDQIELWASTSDMITLPQVKDTLIADQVNKFSPSVVKSDSLPIDNILLDTTLNADSTTLLSDSNQPIQKKRNEPLGIMGFLLILLGPLFAMLSDAFLTIIVITIVLGFFLAISSLNRIWLNKEKWKGRFFGIATLIAAIVYSILLSIIIAIARATD